jgi:hypothetical protein
MPALVIEDKFELTVNRKEEELGKEEDYKYIKKY